MDRAAAAFFAAVEPFTVRIGAPNAFADAIFLEVDDGGALQRLNAALIEHLPLAHRYPNDSPNFLPHVTVATFEDQTDIDALRDILAGLRRVNGGAALTIDTVMLARYWLLATGAESDPIKAYHLRGRRP
jgi:2'-5' RNA ligase